MWLACVLTVVLLIPLVLCSVVTRSPRLMQRLLLAFSHFVSPSYPSLDHCSEI